MLKLHKSDSHLFTYFVAVKKTKKHLRISDLSGAAKKDRYRKKASEYMDRAELLAKQIEAEKATGKYHEQV
jgi:hypothetical protein